MEINQITLENWMPYYGTQIIELSHGDNKNVNIVYARNGKGKTSVMYAVFWCLYGKVIDNKTKKEIPENDFLNFRAQKNSDLKCSVKLVFEHDAIKYEFVRTADFSGGDPKTTLAAWRNKQSISNIQADAAITRIVPERMARFWLIDAKLKEEYETLLVSKTIGQVKEFINDIQKALGFEVFQTAHNLLGQYKNVLDERIKNHKSIEKQRKILVERHGEETAKIENAKNEIKKLDANISEDEKKVEEISEKIGNVEELTKANQNCGLYEELIKDHETEISNSNSKLRDLNDNLWSGILHEESLGLKNEIQQKLYKITTIQNNNRITEAKIEIIKKSLADECCEICKTPVSKAIFDLLEDRKKELNSKSDTDFQEVEMYNLRTLLQTLEVAQNDMAQNDIGSNIKDQITKITDRLGQLQTEKIDYETKLKEAKDKIKNYKTNDTDLTKVIEDLTKAQARILESKKAKNSQDGIIAHAKDKIEEIEESPDWKTVMNESGIKHKADQLSAIKSIFKAADQSYAKELAEGIEETANEIFSQMYTAEDAKKRIKLNSRFGLDLYIGGQKMRNSSGMAVMSLLTFSLALNKYQKFERPIVTDEILSDLDNDHKSSTILSLANQSKQVLLFAHTGAEYSTIRELLNDRLGHYYTIESEDVHWSKIVKDKI